MPVAGSGKALVAVPGKDKALIAVAGRGKARVPLAGEALVAVPGKAVTGKEARAPLPGKDRARLVVAGTDLPGKDRAGLGVAGKEAQVPKTRRKWFLWLGQQEWKKGQPRPRAGFRRPKPRPGCYRRC